ncbi:hypothetical protein C922_03622 [Plasmodium inui San Antonio 1]|uniref:Uncharacterized protein n=1 Tax=Plasmodium inui San Antonio 1 TaxID=1237626 RepID=W7A3I3_9APIC|nr:hypothetical protein C922_03622 [Plasmodium inui San Antonio 1]EUD65898.1 hypothetical protein C922_03622 [Plasmodium inui San Antonio 1]
MPEVVDELKLFLTNLAKGSESVDAKDLLSAGIADKSVIQNIEAKLGGSPWNVERLIELGIDTIQSGHENGDYNEEDNQEDNEKDNQDEEEHELEQRQDSSDDLISDLGSARVVRRQFGPPVDAESYGGGGEQSGAQPGDGSSEDSYDFTANQAASHTDDHNGSQTVQRCEHQGETPMKEADFFHTNITLKSCSSIAEEVKKQAQQSCINLHPVVKEFICLLVFLFARIREEGGRAGTSRGDNADQSDDQNADVSSDGSGGKKCNGGGRGRRCNMVRGGRTGPSRYALLPKGSTAEYEEHPPDVYPGKRKKIRKIKYLNRSGQECASICKEICWKEDQRGEDPSSNSNGTNGESDEEEGNFPFSGYSNGEPSSGAHYRNEQSSLKSPNTCNRRCHHGEDMQSVLFTLNRKEDDKYQYNDKDRYQYSMDDIEQALEKGNVNRVCEKIYKHMKRVSQMKNDQMTQKNIDLITSLLYLTYTHLGLSLLRSREVFLKLCHLRKQFQKYKEKSKQLKRELEKKVKTYYQKIKSSEECTEECERLKASYEEVKKDNDKLKRYDFILHRLRMKVHLLEADKVLLAKRKEELELVVRRKGAYFVGSRQGAEVKATKEKVTQKEVTTARITKLVPKRPPERSGLIQYPFQSDKDGDPLPDGTRKSEDNIGEEQQAVNHIVEISPADQHAGEKLIFPRKSESTKESETKKSACHMVEKSIQTMEEIQFWGHRISRSHSLCRGKEETGECNPGGLTDLGGGPPCWEEMTDVMGSAAWENRRRKGMTSKKGRPSDRKDTERKHTSPFVRDILRTCGRTALVHVESTHLVRCLQLRPPLCLPPFMRHGGDKAVLERFHFGEAAQFEKNPNRGCFPAGVEAALKVGLPKQVVTPLWRKTIIENLCGYMVRSHLSGGTPASHVRLLNQLADVYWRFSLYDEGVDEIEVVGANSIRRGVRSFRDFLDRLSFETSRILSHLLSQQESIAQSWEAFISSFCCHFFRGENELLLTCHEGMCAEGDDSSVSALSLKGGSEDRVGGILSDDYLFRDHSLGNQIFYPNGTITEANTSEGLNYFGLFPPVGVYVRGVTHHWASTPHTQRGGAFPWNEMDQRAETHTNRKDSPLEGADQLTLHRGSPVKDIYPNHERLTKFYVDTKTHVMYVTVDGTLGEGQLTGRSPNEHREWESHPQMGSIAKQAVHHTCQCSPQQSNNPSRKVLPLVWESPLRMKKKGRGVGRARRRGVINQGGWRRQLSNVGNTGGMIHSGVRNPIEDDTTEQQSIQMLRPCSSTKSDVTWNRGAGAVVNLGREAWFTIRGGNKRFCYPNGRGESSHGRISTHDGGPRDRSNINHVSDLIAKGHRYGVRDGKKKFLLVGWRKRVKACHRVLRGTSRGGTRKMEKGYLNEWGNRNRSCELIRKNRMWIVAISLFLLLIVLIDSYLFGGSILLSLLYCVCLAMLLTVSMIKQLIHMMHVPFSEKILSQDWLDFLCVYFIRMVNHFHRGWYESGEGVPRPS